MGEFFAGELLQAGADVATFQRRHASKLAEFACACAEAQGRRH